MDHQLDARPSLLQIFQRKRGARRPVGTVGCARRRPQELFRALDPGRVQPRADDRGDHVEAGDGYVDGVHHDGIDGREHREHGQGPQHERRHPRRPHLRRAEAVAPGPEESQEHDALDREGREPEKAGQRHLEHLHPFEAGHGVGPFRARPEVPGLPEGAADQPGQEGAEERSRFPRLEVAQEAAPRVPAIPGLQQEDEAAPGQWEEDVRPQQGQDQTREAERDHGSLLARRPGQRAQAHGARHAQVLEQLEGLHDPGQDAGEREHARRPTQRRPGHAHHVVPVAEAEVHDLEERPPEHGHAGQPQEVRGPVAQERAAAPAAVEVIRGRDVGPPGEVVVPGGHRLHEQGQAERGEREDDRGHRQDGHGREDSGRRR